MDLPFDGLMSTIGTLGVIAGLIIAYLELRHQRKVATASFTLKLCYDIFDSKPLLMQRKKLAAFLEELQEGSSKEQVFARVDREAREPLDLMEDIGGLLRSGVVDRDLIYSSLSYWILHYWLLTKEYIDWTRKTDPLFFKNFEYLYKEMLDLEARARGRDPADLEKELIGSPEVRRFIEYEKHIEL